MTLSPYARHTLVATALLLSWQSATAALTARDLDLNGQTDVVYDSATNLTWLIDGALAGSSSFGTVTSGAFGAAIDYAGAQAWIGSLNTTQLYGVTGWRLPTLLTCPASDCTIGSGEGGSSSEWAVLFYGSLGNGLNVPLLPSYVASVDPFRNINDRDFWLASDLQAGNPWFFSTSIGGSQTQVDAANTLHALAVFDGNLVVSSVPEPETNALLLLGLGALAMARRRVARATRTVTA